MATPQTPLELPSFVQKIHRRADLEQGRVLLPRPLVFTNGVFDVLHRGHASYLDRARALAGPQGSLLVALNTDASARRLGKGPDRPLNGEEDRAMLLAAKRKSAGGLPPFPKGFFDLSNLALSPEWQ